ncbi:MAG: hypothetical protein R3C18_15355 [Planctomycetaceae bacterium]
MTTFPSKPLYSTAFAVLGLVLCQPSLLAAEDELLTSFDELVILLEQDSVPHDRVAEGAPR